MKSFSERTAELLFDFFKFVVATVIIGRVFGSLGNVEITDSEFILAVILAFAALAFGYVFDNLASREGGKK